MAWDLNLCMDWSKKVLIPFHYFVKPESQLPPARPFRFLDLPFDLQLLICEHCDAPTLFHLMRTSSHIRGTARKLFWTNSLTDCWYHCPTFGLFEFGTRNHVILQHCPEFARRIKRAEIDFVRIEYHFAEDNEASTAAKAQDFWAKMGRVFPAVDSVVLSGYSPGDSPAKSSPPPPEGDYEAYVTIRKVVQFAPSHITVQVALNDNGISGYPRHFTLYQVSDDLDAKWEVLDGDWTPIRVLLPPRRFPVSPPGDLLTFSRRNSALLLEVRGLDWLRVESYARYAVKGIIHCPRLDCDAIFTERNAWKQHLKESSHNCFESRFQSTHNYMDELWPYKHTPEAEKAAIEARQQYIEECYNQNEKLELRVGHG